MNKLREFRKVNNLTQENIAKVLNTTREQVYLYETGKRELKESQIAAICRAYKVNPLEILKIEEPEMGGKSNATK